MSHYLWFRSCDGASDLNKKSSEFGSKKPLSRLCVTKTSGEGLVADDTRSLLKYDNIVIKKPS